MLSSVVGIPIDLFEQAVNNAVQQVAAMRVLMDVFIVDGHDCYDLTEAKLLNLFVFLMTSASFLMLRWQNMR